MIKHLNIVFILSLLGMTACGSNGIEGYVGEEISITAENPEEGKKFDYDWALVSLPDGSLLSETDLILDERSKKMAFTPDYPGDYSFDVIISKYGDEVSTQSFSFTILDEDAKEQEVASNNQESDEDDVEEEIWLNEEIEDSDDENIYVEEDDSEDYLEDEYEEEVEVEEEPVADVQKIAPTLKKPVIKKAKPKPNPGSSIPANFKRFTIQVVSKRTLKDAQKTAAELIMAGYDVYIQKAFFKETNETWFRVRIGSYDNRNSAIAVANAVSKNLGIKAWVDFVRFE
ncbi:MAG: SPOR domain-containing protein [Candidatus Marinimicrobia bacterium]|jgi:cell division septation protein DedD|nr:SPOR domain-containing protein [Candidatus Neomarinimicrobiota bacterium]MBT3937187.1 SPOR domain-containing protein [Candidatus Neomarinimicrobiota bacterium]MBT3960861.1 SPOR domain-containing protein [Candidatus Neomarinimicrobiota bacterium]MBT4383551.1 SPOR domain-containing protein [Candidatus Neomarinimicrobiota bacterium]MBT4636853.1 SPOR domain-containing protein [Candidatus Neomarinimicrobiota bacterium]